MNNYFYVDTDDEITSVIGKIREEKAEEIFLVVPKRALIAQSLVNLRLLDKEAKKYKKKLVFVSPDAHIRKLAEKAGLAVKKYVAKPKDEGKEEALALAPKPRKLEPWEEEAAKRELASVIKSKEEEKPNGPVSPQIFSRGTKIAVGAFSKFAPEPHRGPENIIERRKKSADVIDLKKTQLRRRDMSFARKKLKPSIIQPKTLLHDPATEKRPIPDATRGQVLSKKETFPRENVEKPRKKVKAAVNPFRVRKLEKSTQYLVPPPIGRVGSTQFGETEKPQFVARNAQIQTQNNLPADLERETANLTLKEKERLRDLWMEQKGVVRGKYVQNNASLDLASANKELSAEEKISSQSSGLFKTTHQRVGNPGKIVDLRLGPKAHSELPQTDFGKSEKNDRKVVLLPLINIKFFSLFVLIILLVLAVIAGIIIPDARIIIKPNVSKSDLAMNFWVSGEVSQGDANEHLIPGKPIHFKVSEEKNFSTSGSREIKENAQGQITIYNKTADPLSLKQNALLTDSSGKKFYTQVPVLVPAGGTTNSNANDNTSPTTGEIKAGRAVVAVKAEGIGKEYNLKEGAALTIPGLAGSDFGSGVTAEVKKEIVGGERRTVKIVTREDIDKAKEELLNRAREDSRGELEKNLGGDTNRIVKPEALSVEDIAYTVSIAEGEEADTFNANLTATFFTVAFSRRDLEELAKNIVETNSSAEGGSVNMNDYNLTEAKPLENKMEISATLSYQKTNQLDAAEIRRQLTAKKKGEAEEFLRGNKDIAEFHLDLWPGWPARLPLLERRIKVEIK